MRAFAAAIAVFVQRFPDWQSYQDVDAEDDSKTRPTNAEGTAFIGLGKVIDETEQADADIKAELQEAIRAGIALGASTDEIQGMSSSSREIYRTLAERTMEDAKTGAFMKRQTQEMEQIGKAEWSKVKWYAGGFTLDALNRAAPELRRLAASRPKTFGWVVPVLNYIGAKGSEPPGA
jgi:hypothetical protein